MLIALVILAVLAVLLLGVIAIGMINLVDDVNQMKRCLNDVHRHVENNLSDIGSHARYENDHRPPYGSDRLDRMQKG